MGRPFWLLRTLKPETGRSIDCLPSNLHDGGVAKRTLGNLREPYKILGNLWVSWGTIGNPTKS